MSFAIAAGAAIAVGGSMVAANQSEIAGREAESQQQQRQEQGMDQQMVMFDKAREDRAPWVEAGKDVGLAGLTNMLYPNQRGQMYKDYYASPEFVAQQNQASKNVGRAQSAHGGLRGGSTYSQLENVAPQLGANYMSNMQNQYTNLANMGIGMAGQNAAGYQQIGDDQMNMYNQMGANQSNRVLANQNQQNQVTQTAVSGLSSIANQYFGGRV